MDTSVRSAKPPAKRNRKEKKPSRIPVIRELPQLSKPAALTGYFLRAVISAAAAASLLLLIAAAFFPQYSFTSDVLLCALLDTAAFAVAGLSGKFIFIGLGAFFAEYALRLFLTHISPAVLLRECVVSFFNGIADKPVAREDGEISVRFLGKTCSVTMNPNTGKLIQTNPRRDHND